MPHNDYKRIGDRKSNDTMKMLCVNENETYGLDVQRMCFFATNAGQ